MKIKAAVIREMKLPQPYAESLPLSIEEVELAAPGEAEVLVQIKAAGLCHSDLSTINGDDHGRATASGASLAVAARESDGRRANGKGKLRRIVRGHARRAALYFLVPPRQAAGR
jgi:threonine dehydrogenase-like Zn-dependent dehydrogenase